MDTHTAQLPQSESPEEEVGDALGGGQDKVLKEGSHLICGGNVQLNGRTQLLGTKHTLSSTSTTMASTWLNHVPTTDPISNSHLPGREGGVWEGPGN